MAVTKKEKPERVLLTVELGEEKLALLDDCLRHCVGLNYDERQRMGLKRWGMITRSALMRLAVDALHKQLNPTPATKARRK
jgi:hypothetical protein